ncbi:hypothetical protein DERP_010146 [Dermatophagoides pteronyssinus]|uniref:Uncharacterized protein n=1 Tax=Dermatophagoides pteronyssinus TaxID=6956 RepID=A0ABQ8J6S7_DERPT|nr:hypothetical protein DERP_010146 [Dermatophagoides pteronyssinus]
MNIILRPFLEDMKKLERHGINVKKSDGSTVNMKVGLAKLICDNLAQNEILGFKMSFGQGSICRECLTKREDYKTSRLHGLFDYSNVTFECLPRPEKRIRPNDYGLKNECILTELGGVNIGNIMPPDMFHDLHEGCIEWIIAVVLFSLMKSSKKALSQHAIINKMEHFQLYHGRISVDYKSKKFTVYGTGIQKFECFMRLREIFFKEFSVMDGESTSLYMDMAKFVRLASRSSQDFAHLMEMDRLSGCIIDKYVSICQRMSLDFNVTYKIHKILHYAEAVRRFGPLPRNSTLRYERCHQNSKKYGRNMNNWVAPAQSLSQRQALRQTLSFRLSKDGRDGWIEDDIIDEEMAKSMKLTKAKSDQAPFSLKKNVLRKFKSRGFQQKHWLLVDKFLINPQTQQIFCEGSLWCQKDEDSIYDPITGV